MTGTARHRAADRAKSEAADAIARGLAFHQAGRLDAASAEYARALALDPGNVDANNLGGLAAHQRGDNAAALRMLARAVEIAPNFHHALQHLADVQRLSGDLDAALTTYSKLAAVAPDWPGGPFGIGLVRHARGDLAGAERAVRDAIARKADFAPGLSVLAGWRMQAGDAAGALGFAEQVHAANPTPASWYNLASFRLAAGDRAGAEAAARACLDIAPDFGAAILTLGDILISARRLEDAAAFAERPSIRDSCIGEALVFRGELAVARWEPSAAMRMYLRACLAFLGEPAPDLPPTELRARLEARLGDIERRLDAGEEGLRASLAPRVAPGLLVLAYQMLVFGDVADARRYAALAVRAGAVRAERNLIAFDLYDPDATPESFARSRREFARHCRKAVPSAPPPPSRGTRVKLRIGYVSADFRVHPAANCMLPLFEARDRTRFEVFAYSLTSNEDTITARFRRSADAWRAAAAMDDAKLAQTIREDRIDILVIYAGHFQKNRLALALHRPAPIIVSFGDCASSGLAEIDYLFADAGLVPRHSPEPFAERVLRLPVQYVNIPPTDAPAPQPRSADRRGPCFVSFSNPSKLNARTLDLWAELLACRPDATLTLGFRAAFDDPGLAAHTRAPFLARGIDPARVRFRPPPADHDAHMRSYAAADVALDPFPFNGATTTFEALWMGVPVVTLTGATMVSRWSAAILPRVGLADLCAADPESYIEAAIATAADTRRLGILRRTLRERLAASTMCRPDRWIRYVERAYGAIWRARRTPTRSGRPLD